MRREKILVGMLLLIILFLYIFRITLIANLASHEEEVAEQKQAIDDQGVQNNEIEIKLLKLTALTNIADKAKKEGLMHVTKYVTPTAEAGSYIKR